MAAWLFKGFMTLGLSLSSIAFCYLPVMAIWATGVWKLGHAYQDLKAQLESAKDG